jgi:hypothetical protein
MMSGQAFCAVIVQPGINTPRKHDESFVFQRFHPVLARCGCPLGSAIQSGPFFNVAGVNPVLRTGKFRKPT